MQRLAAFIAVVGVLLPGIAGWSLTDRQAAPNCSELELVIARGTAEPLNPSFGVVVGDPLFQATKKLIPGVTGYAVDYPASTACNSADLGAADTLKHLVAASQSCPQQKYVLAGYSQGADVMHAAARNISTALFPRIIALVMFGDPGNKSGNETSERGEAIPPFPAPLAEKLKENCAFGDPVCSNGTDISAHIIYNDRNVTYIPDSATYIQKQLQTDGKAGSDPSPNGGSGGAANAAALSSLGSLLGNTHTGTAACSTASSNSTSTSAATTTSGAAGKTTGTSAVPGSSTMGSATTASSTAAASRPRPFQIFL